MRLAQLLGLTATVMLVFAHPLAAGARDTAGQTAGQAADQAAALRAQALRQLRRAERQTPYSKLFPAPELKAAQPDAPPATDEPQSREPRVVCGMTIIPVDPNIDPKIKITPPANNVRHTMRVIEPPVCK